MISHWEGIVAKRISGSFYSPATLMEIKANSTIHSVYFVFQYQHNKINCLLTILKMTDESELQVMLCMKDVLIHPPEGETLWYNLQLLRWIQHFFHIYVLIFPTAWPILISKSRSQFCSLCSAAAREGTHPWMGRTGRRNILYPLL